MLHMLIITAISVRCVLGSLSCTFPYSGHFQVRLEREAHGKPSLARRRTSPGFWGARGASVWLTGHAACPAIQSLHGFASSSPWAGTLSCCWPRDEMCSMHQISALLLRQRHAREQGKAKAVGEKTLISAAPPWNPLGRWLNFTAELPKMSSYQIHSWVFRLNWCGLIFLSGKYLGLPLQHNTWNHFK